MRSVYVQLFCATLQRHVWSCGYFTRVCQHNDLDVPSSACKSQNYPLPHLIDHIGLRPYTISLNDVYEQILDVERYHHQHHHNVDSNDIQPHCPSTKSLIKSNPSRQTAELIFIGIIVIPMYHTIVPL